MSPLEEELAQALGWLVNNEPGDPVSLAHGLRPLVERIAARAESQARRALAEEIAKAIRARKATQFLDVAFSRAAPMAAYDDAARIALLTGERP